MLLDLIANENSLTLNINLAHAVGLNAAIYCSELINIFKKAIRKNKLINGFLKVDREYIFRRTTLSIEEQLKCDEVLNKISLIERSDNKDIIKLDIILLLSLITNEDEQTIKEINSSLIVEKKLKKTKKGSIIINLKKNISCSNLELNAALEDWIDSVCNNNCMTSCVVEKFQKTLFDYTKGNLELALKIVEIATIHAYKDCTWAINSYERGIAMQNSIKKNNPLQVRVENLIEQKASLSLKKF